MKVKVIFIGGLTNGKVVYDYLVKNKYVDLSLVITYPDNNNGPRHVNFPDAENIIKTFEANAYAEVINTHKPDFIIVAGWSELLSNDLVNASSKGTIGFHPSKLPFDRGRSVIAWQIEDGYTETGLSMFYYNDLPDGGDIISIEKIPIETNDYVNDILNKVDIAIYNLMYAYFPLLRIGKAPRLKQNMTEGNFRRLRKTKDSLINWNSNSTLILNKIRSISKPYPGAEAQLENKMYKIYEAETILNFPLGKEEKPGVIIAHLFDKTIIVKTKDGFLKITKHEIIE
jgi:methionyl-tRNA formyltransferase